MSLVPIPPTALAIYISGAQCMIGFYVCSVWEGDVPLSALLGSGLVAFQGCMKNSKGLPPHSVMMIIRYSHKDLRFPADLLLVEIQLLPG